MKEAVIVSAVRTPIAKVRGALTQYEADELAGFAINEAIKRAKIAPEEIEEVFFGNCRNIDLQTPARVCALQAGLPLSVPGVTIERGCGSALSAIYLAAVMIKAGEGKVYLAGGTESCSHGPFLLEKQVKPKNVPPKFLSGRMVPQTMENLSMGMTSEEVAKQYHVTRKDCDEFALRSQRLGCAAWEKGYFDEQIVPIPVKRDGKEVLFTRDETIRPDTSLEGLSNLKPSFKEDGVSTAGNSSPLVDGASALVIMEKEYAISRGITPLATIKEFASAGLEPNIMGMGPMVSTRKLLKKTGLTLDDIDLIEINEAFAAQSVACCRELNLDMEKVNVNGGAISLGHPFGATGAILTTKMVYELKRRNLHRGLITFCIGGGQGVAMLIENE